MNEVEAFFDGGFVGQGVLSGGMLMALLSSVLGTPSSVRRPWVGVLLSFSAAIGLYACTPDTELARLIAGGVVGAGAVAVAWSLPWAAPAAIVTVLLAVAAVADGSARDSAVIGGIGIAVVHQVAQRAARRGRPGVVLVVAGAGIAVCSRVAGMEEGWAAPLLVTVATVSAVVGVLTVRARPRLPRKGGRAQQDGP